jgi:hypothetical protein
LEPVIFFVTPPFEQMFDLERFKNIDITQNLE